MALWPNNRTDILGRFPVGQSGYLAFSEVAQNPQKRIAYFAGSAIAATSSVPEGSAGSASNLILPIVGGAMASANNAVDFSITASGNALAGGPMSGDAPISVVGNDSQLSMTMGMDGSASMTLDAGTAALAMTISLDGSVSWSLTGNDSSLSLIVPFGGSTTISLTGSADLRGLLSMSGQSTSATELSPESLASAVLNAIASEYNAPGTIGNKINSAASGGVDYAALANAVWGQIIEGGLDAAEFMRLLMAPIAGDMEKVSDTVRAFKSLDGTKDRVRADVINGERNVTFLDGT